MSKQPLTNINDTIVILARSEQAANEELEKYNFSPDETDSIPPTINKIILTSYMQFILDTPSMYIPYVIVGSPPVDLVYAAKQWFTTPKTMAAALLMYNNEYAIRRDQIVNGTVKQT